MFAMLKRIAQSLPAGWKHELKRHYYAWQLKRGTFRTSEREFDLLDQFVKPGDWVIDIGANVGHYTARLSQLVGEKGRVVAFEPVPATFRLLADNSRLFRHSNVTLVNAAASDHPQITGIEVPMGPAGSYLAHIAPNSLLKVLCMPVDSLQLSQRVALVKIDAEGHELAVLRGMTGLLDRDQPTLIVEVSHPAASEFLQSRRYTKEKLAGSPNCIFRKAPTP